MFKPWSGYLESMHGQAPGFYWRAEQVRGLFYIDVASSRQHGFNYYNPGGLRVIQEVIAMVIWARFSFLYMMQPRNLDHLWAGLCLGGAACFLFGSELRQV